MQDRKKKSVEEKMRGTFGKSGSKAPLTDSYVNV